MKIILDTSSHTFRTIFTLSLFLFSFILIGSSAYSAWTNPAGTAPNSNVDAPVNVGATSQIKTGALQVNGFINDGNTILRGNTDITGLGADWALDARAPTYGIYGQGSYYGVYGETTSSGYGVVGNASTGYGVQGTSVSSIGVRGNTATSYAGYFTATGAGGGLYAQNGSGYYAFLGYPASSWGVYTNGNSYTGGQVRGDGGFCIGGSCITSWPSGGISAVTTSSCSSNSGGCYATCPSGYYRTGCSVVPNHPYYSTISPSGSNACYVQGGNSESSASGYVYCAR